MEVLDSRWSVREMDEFRGSTVEWTGKDHFLLSSRNALYRLDRRPGAPLTLIGRFPASHLREWLSVGRAAQRLLRFMYHNVVELPGERLFLTFDKSVGLFENGQIRPIEGLLRPTRVLRSACAADRNGSVFFGEYLSNQDRGPIRIYRYRAGEQSLEVVNEFGPGAVRHVHGVYADPFSDALWCVTGDVEGECRILRTTDEFRTIDVVGTGDETWRTVSLLFRPEAVYYGSDAEFEQNHAYRIDRRSGDRTRLGPLEGPVYYSKSVGGDLYLAVTAELCPSQTEPVASIWHISDTDDLTRVLKVNKDTLPKQFLPGTIHFANGPADENEVFFHTVALEGDDRSYRLTKNS